MLHGVLLACAICVLMPQSPRSAGGSDYWDSDTGDAFVWKKRLELVIDNPDSLERVAELIEIPLERLPWVDEESFASLRVVDPSAPPDGPREVGGNDLPFQIDQTDAGRLLVFQVDCEAGQARKTIYLYASAGKRAPEPRYVSDLTVSDLGSRMRLSNARLALEVDSKLNRVWLDGKQVLDGGQWIARRAMASGQSAGHRGARVRMRKVTCDGPVRKRLHLETDCNAEEDPQATQFALDIDLFSRRPELLISTTIRPQNLRCPSFQFVTAVSPDGDFEAGRTRYAYLGRSGHLVDAAFSTRMTQNPTPPDAQDAAVVFDSVSLSRSLILVAGTDFEEFMFSAAEGKVHVQYRPKASCDDELRRAKLWLGFSDGGPELLRSYVRRRHQPLRPFFQGNLLACPADRQGSLPRGLEVDLTRLVLHVRGDARPTSVEAWDWHDEDWQVLKECGTTLYEVPRSAAHLSPRGEMRVRAKPAPEAVYLLGRYPGAPIPLDSQSWLRNNSLAYSEGPFQPGTYVHVGHCSHRVEASTKGEITERFLLDGKAFLAEPVAVLAGGRIARREAEGLYSDPLGNPIRIAALPKGDRLRFEVCYSIREPQEASSCVSLVFRPSSPPTQLETLTLAALSDGYTEHPCQDKPLLRLSHRPFVALRCRNHQYLGFLDHDQSNLVLRATPNDVAVEYWTWPNQRGREYHWTFELVPGYGTFANAMLRALDPHTADFRGRLQGDCGLTGAVRRAEECKAAGICAAVYSGATYRHGLYFQPERPLDAAYDTPMQTITSYRKVVEDVHRAHEHGLKVLLQMQFAGVSSPVIPEFFDAMVQDSKLNLVKVGCDGRFITYWANPNPDLSYGRSLLEQVEGLMSSFGCDGIAMECCDRLDDLEGRNLFDLGRSDGTACPSHHGGSYRPCSSVTLQAKRFWLQLRAQLDRRQGLWIAGQPRSMLIFRLADAIRADLHHSPWNLFFLRSMSNGKNFLVYSRPFSSNWSAASARLAQLVQAQSMLEIPAGQPINAPAKSRMNTRLLYIVPSEDLYPRYWLFHRGGAVLDYDSAGGNTAEGYKGSRVVRPEEN